MADKTPGSFPWQHIPSPGKVYGTARVGERGQIAIPADARRELGIDPGDKVVVFGNRLNGAVTLVKADIFEDFAEFFMTKLGKLGEHASEFFSHFTAEAAAEDDEPGSDSTPADADESASDPAPAEAAPAEADVAEADDEPASDAAPADVADPADPGDVAVAEADPADAGDVAETGPVGPADLADVAGTDSAP